MTSSQDIAQQLFKQQIADLQAQNSRLETLMEKMQSPAPNTTASSVSASQPLNSSPNSLVNSVRPISLIDSPTPQPPSAALIAARRNLDLASTVQKSRQQIDLHGIGIGGGLVYLKHFTLEHVVL